MKVSIVTVVYNNVNHIQRAIDSVKSQDYFDIEFIVIDGGSVDGTLSVLNMNLSKIDFLVSEPDYGIYDAMNKGISFATGDIIGILNSDDQFFSSTVISSVVKIFQESNDLDAVIGNVEYLSDSNLSYRRHYLSHNFRSWMMRFGFMPAHTAAFISRIYYQKIGLYSTKYQIASDFDWFCRSFADPDFHFRLVNFFYVRMRLGGVSSSGVGSAIKISNEMLNILKLNNIYSNIFLIYLRLPLKFFLAHYRRFFLVILNRIRFT